MTNDNGGSGRTRSISIAQIIGGGCATVRNAWLRRRETRELEAVPYEVRKDTGWRSSL